jgi:micrococcal nuclease
MSSRRTRRGVAAVALVGSLVACGTATQQPASSHANIRPNGGSPHASGLGPRPTNADGPYQVAKVVDGDTMKVLRAGRVVNVRLIGIDTPETRDPRKPVQCYGREASARAKTLLDGRRVWLEHDDTQGLQDHYGRELAYVWLDEITLFNEVMIREGYAHEYTYDSPYRYRTLFRRAQVEASQRHAGLWANNTCRGDTGQTRVSG